MNLLSLSNGSEKYSVSMRGTQKIVVFKAHTG
jgi:hypothetical protein